MAVSATVDMVTEVMDMELGIEEVIMILAEGVGLHQTESSTKV